MVDERTGGGPDRRPAPTDYDRDPDRFLAGHAVTREFGAFDQDVYEVAAVRCGREGRSPLLDLGCGYGRLATALRGQKITWIGLDRSATLLRQAPRPAVLGDAGRLPFADGSFAAVAALYMLYHLADPLVALREAHRVLRPGGLFVACAPSRFDSPELHDLVPPDLTLTFDAELAPDLFGGVFGQIEVQAWDAPLIRLPDADALRRYLFGRGMTDAATAARLANRKTFPLTITKRGALVYGRKAGSADTPHQGRSPCGSRDRTSPSARSANWSAVAASASDGDDPRSGYRPVVR
jgi:SAM-dependent methyltransferase